ncbi:hypothetical protein QCA50_002772 [Cerrena zonata]|uniref:Uncharacterized protein n=1 Tax=Cerrena zonata TaxID=2478898 RepID=A0AAW0GKM5_9APHY
MMRATKIYEHPEFTTEEADLSLFSTICLVLTMALMGALFLMTFSSFVLWNDSTHFSTGYQPASVFWATQKASPLAL